MPDIMGKMDIAFPNLGIYLTNVPQDFYIGNFRVALYGCVIALGMILGILMATHIAKKTGQDPNMYWDISIWLIIFALVGARIFYVIFFWDAYKDDPLQIFNLRAGGLAIYGGVIGGIITAYVYCVIKKKFLPEVLDTAAYGLIVGQIVGRWGNFFNREVFGEYTDNLFAMRLPIEMVRERDITPELASHILDGTNYIQVHPTFLYEGLWNLGVLIFMLVFLKHRRFKGEITLIYFIGYGIGRAWIESIRTDQLYMIGTTIPVNEVLGICLAVFGAVMIVMISSRRKGKPRIGYGVRTAAETADGIAAAEENTKDAGSEAVPTENANDAESQAVPTEDANDAESRAVPTEDANDAESRAVPTEDANDAES